MVTRSFARLCENKDLQMVRGLLEGIKSYSKPVRCTGSYPDLSGNAVNGLGAASDRFGEPVISTDGLTVFFHSSMTSQEKYYMDYHVDSRRPNAICVVSPSWYAVTYKRNGEAVVATSCPQLEFYEGVRYMAELYRLYIR